MQYKEPRCENCGAKLFPRVNPYYQYSPLFGKIPSHCSNCGTEISNEKRAQIDKHTTFIFGITCAISILILVIGTIIFFNSHDWIT